MIVMDVAGQIISGPGQAHTQEIHACSNHTSRRARSGGPRPRRLIAISFAAARFAGECPADKIKRSREKVDYKPVGVTDVTLGAINLGKQPAKIKDRELRFRKLTIEPGGIVPWHSHDDRPALIYVQQGEIVEYASNCPSRSCTRPARSAPRSTAPRTGGRTSARRRSFSMSATSARTRTTTNVTMRHAAIVADVAPWGIPVLPRTPRRHILPKCPGRVR